MIAIEDIIEELKIHNPNATDLVQKAYQLADYLHKGQQRESGEPYIIHPLTVAKNLLDMEIYDQDTICAALLHDVLEDSDEITKEEIAELLNPEVAELVDGVTKLSRLNFTTKEEQNMANTRKIINGLIKDVRIIQIKLADRLHNMQTLEFKSIKKQKENALETQVLYVPLAYHIGAYRIKTELEDLSFQYLDPIKYERIKKLKEKIDRDNKPILTEMSQELEEHLLEREIKNEIKIRTKNIYGIYTQLNSGLKLPNIHDLCALKIMVQEIDQCYLTLGMIHSKYHPINERFKDYIYNPKTNMYRSIHTTVFGPEEKLVQTQIRTFDMDKVASFGVSAYWNQQDGMTKEETQKLLKEHCQFGRTLIEINKNFEDNKEFVDQVKEELLTENVYVYDTSGEVVELPKGSTPIDFAYHLSTDTGNSMTGAIVNEQKVSEDYLLKNKDRVKIMTSVLEREPKENWDQLVKTTRAKRKIKERKKSSLPQ